jgi:hypothetical protein
MTTMHRGMWMLLLGTLLAWPASGRAAVPVESSQAFVPDPAAVERYGPAYRYPQAGWIVLHIEGEPYERGYQHGRLLSTEIVDYIKAQAANRSPQAPADAWRAIRMTVNALFLRRFDREYLEEMKGIADGASAAGAKFDGRPLDLVDIAATNSDMELFCLESALEATTTGLEGERFQQPSPIRPASPPPEHCSAFAATGPATADGKVVFGHITMFGLLMTRHYNVWIDIKPTKGHRVLMQTYPGGIQSGMDYYMNDAGLLVSETTITQTKFDIDGRALASRIRRTLQYADSIDQAVEILKADNNGLYTNEWLLADTRTNEVAMFELGTHKSKLWRSSKNEWLAGTEGFYWGCNNTKDLAVRLETVAGVDEQPHNVVFHPTDRDKTWISLYQANKGKISAEFGFLAFTTPPLAAFHSCDAKFTTTDMAGELKTYALFGPPLGRTWDPSAWELRRWPEIKPLVSNDWTVLRANAPAPAPSSSNGTITQPVDIARQDREPSADRGSQDAGLSPVPGRRSTRNLPPAWRGTLLPKTDADTWLAAAFADYEKIVAHEKQLRYQSHEGKLGRDERDQLELAMFAPRSQYLTAVVRFGKDVPLADTKTDMTRDEWYQIASGKGVLLLAALSELMGSEKFEIMMDSFGRAHAGQPVTTSMFFEHAEKAHGKPLATFVKSWVERPGLPKEGKAGAGAQAGPWAIDSFEAEPEQALIVYGTLKESHAQREAAERLQRSIQRRWSNVTVGIKTDREVGVNELADHHLLLIGRPDSNAVVPKCTKGLPVTFGPASFVVRSDTYANAASAVIAAGSNPLNPRYSVVVFAGLSAEATWQCATQPSDHAGEPTPVMIVPATGAVKRLVVPTEGKAAPVAQAE